MFKRIVLQCFSALSITYLVTGCISSKTTNTSTHTTHSSGGSLNERVTSIDNYLTAVGINGGLLIAHKGKILINKGYGWANEESKSAITPNSIFNIGSVSKQFTAAAILKLEEQGKLKTSDTITSFFSNVPEDKRSITIHSLLTHTAGFIHTLSDETSTTRDELVSRILKSKLRFSVGERSAYSNAGYQLLAAIIEVASGGGFEEYLRQNLWLPAGMLYTGKHLPEWQKDNFVRSYDFSGDVDTQNKNLWGASQQPSWNFGEGSLLSTLNDLHKWHEALNKNQILSVESKKKLFTPYASFKAAIGQAGYAYGWAIQKTPLGTLIEHNGGNGYNFTDFYRYVDEDLVVIYFTNERHTSSLRTLDSIPSFLYGKQFPPFPEPKVKLTKAELTGYTGTYEMPSGDKLIVELINDDLSIALNKVETIRLLTNFPTLEESSLFQNLQVRMSDIMLKIARDSVRHLQEVIELDGSMEEEVAYWNRTFLTWRERFGQFKKVEIIGSTYQNNYLTTYALLQFDKGMTIAEFRQNEQKKFFIGHPSFLLPRYYRLIPQSNSVFLINNKLLQTNTKLSFSNQGMTIHTSEVNVVIRKVVTKK